MNLTIVRTNLRKEYVIDDTTTFVYDCEILTEEGKGSNKFITIETSVYIPALAGLKITIPD